MIDDAAIHLAMRTRLLTTSGLPDANNRAWENKKFTPIAGTQYLEDEYVPGGTSIVSVTVDTGTLEARGFYIVKWYGIENAGIGTIRAGVKAILAKFSIGTRITCSDGNVVRVMGKPIGPSSSQIVPTGDGFAVCTIRIPFWCLTSNAIAA